MKVVYVAGPFSDDDRIHGVERNVLKASEVALKLWRHGFAVICPHKNTSGFQHSELPNEIFYEGDLEILRRCDYVMMIEGYAKSEGAMREYHLAKELGIPILYAWEDWIWRRIND